MQGHPPASGFPDSLSCFEAEAEARGRRFAALREQSQAIQRECSAAREAAWAAQERYEQAVLQARRSLAELTADAQRAVRQAQPHAQPPRADLPD